MSLCQKLKKCLKCCKVLKVNPKKPHKCFYTKCHHCRKYVHIYNRRYYIQKVKEEESNENEEEEMNENEEEEKPPPLMVFADIECLVEPFEDGKKQFVADLICYATGEDAPNVSHTFSGDTYIEQFIQVMNELTEDRDNERDLFIIFQNLKGFDSNFIIEELYRQGIKVEDQLTVGAKTFMFHYMYLESKITFKDSLCFLPMPLDQLPETFNFVEHCKGFFPHAFHTRENLSYHGPLPGKQYFQPQAMKPKKR